MDSVDRRCDDERWSRRPHHDGLEHREANAADSLAADGVRHEPGDGKRPGQMKARRGVALLAALWLVVAIAAVALQFSIEARERRNLGILASERGIQRGLAIGALALMQAKLEYALRMGPTNAGSNPNIARLRASDPWL